MLLSQVRYLFSNKNFLGSELQITGNLGWHILLTSLSVIHPFERN